VKTWSIGEVARLLGVKPHVIRYWESELPLLSAPKGPTGRREYTGREVELLLKVRHLLHERKYTVEGARRAMWEELEGPAADRRAKLSEIRAELVDALMTTRARMADGGAPGSDAEVRRQYEALGQGHLFAHWDARPPAMGARLLDDLRELDLVQLAEMQARLVTGAWQAPAADISPAPFIPLATSMADSEARQAGEEAIRAGRTAFLTVAGGQGSRLGFEGPKGMYPASPIRRLSLFALLAEKLLAARRWYGIATPWLVMTSRQNRKETESFFEKEGFFGLERDDVRFFTQGMLPALKQDGKLVMAPDGGLFLSPNGHGGVVEALGREGLLADLAARGVEDIFYFQVDNPLVTVPDPVFLGLHRREGADVSSKVVRKAFPGEKLGSICIAGGRPCVVEYSDMPEDLAAARGPDGGLRFPQGSIAIHLFRAAFLAGSGEGMRLPWHLARKRVQALNPVPGGTDIQEEEAIKMEAFVFDTIPLARRALFLEVERAEEFAPLKNREGVDCVESCRQGQVEKAARWLESCGVTVARDARGAPSHAIEISPLFAMDRSVLAARRGILKDTVDEDTLLA
jgi:UDP-N-acetylglucosamine/UDP-N-acetylgalactosamine diphosphorylase